MVNGIGRAHKLGKKNRKIPVVTNGTLKTASLDTNRHDTPKE